MPDGSLAWGGGSPTVPTPDGGGTHLTQMSNFILVAQARLEDLVNLGSSAPGVDEVQQVAISGGGNNTNWTLGFGGQTTTPVFVKNPNAATVQAALEALSTIGAGNVAVTGSGWVWNVTFQGVLGDQSVAPLVGTISGGGTIAVTTTTPGAGGTGPISAVSSVGGGGELLITYTDAAQSWTYRALPAIILGSTDVVFVGEISAGTPNAVVAGPPRETPLAELIDMREKLDAQIKQRKADAAKRKLQTAKTG
jgi:hypothetical protein